MLSISAAALGLIAGSFLNALSFRYHTGVSVMRGRSRCMRCGHTLSALELIPILSYVMQGGRCRWCHSRISIQYPLVEAAAAALSLGVLYTSYTPVQFAFWFAVWMIILFIVVYDARHTVIPWSCSIALGALALVYLWFGTNHGIDAVIAGPVLAAPLALVSLVSRGRWMGWGDGVFELSLGWFLGLLQGLSALMLAIWIGAGIGVALVVWAQLPWKGRTLGFTMKSELPFAPFLAVGAALCYFFHVDLFSQLAAFW